MISRALGRITMRPMQSTHRRRARGVFVWINRSSDRAFAITALIFYTVFAIIAFLLEKRRAISS
ncbi:MAG: hypothetical protein ABJB70_05830 [Candidatus Udaeobacter sp.]